MLEGVTAGDSPFVPGSPGHISMNVQSGAATRSGDFASLSKRVRIAPELAAKVYEALKPGATIIVTDNPAVPKASRDLTILAARHRTLLQYPLPTSFPSLGLSRRHMRVGS